MNIILENMLRRHPIDVIDRNNFSTFITTTKNAIVFFSESPNRYPESADVACVLPELLKAYPTLTGALVCEADQHELQQQFDFTRWPSLAFFCHGIYRGAISGIKNWDDYQRLIPPLLVNDACGAIPAKNL